MPSNEGRYKGNKGEWGEVYVLLRLLADGVLYEGDAQMRRTENYLDILGALRKEATQILRFNRDDNREMIIIVGGDGVNRAGIPVQRFRFNAEVLLKEIPQLSSDKTIPSVDDFLEEICLSSVKSNMFTTNDGFNLNRKSDIILRTRGRTGLIESEGYSIKSYFGSPPTLFNCAPASAMTYEIVGVQEDEAVKINLICNNDGGCDLGGRIKYILDHGFTLRPVGTAFVDGRQPFAENLELCGLDMLPLLQQLLLYRYAYRGKTNRGHLSQVIEMMIAENPLDVHHPEAYYPARIKQFAYDSFAGLVATEQWDGSRKINGGYIDVKADGEVLFYPARSDDQFTSFLLRNLRIEVPDKGIGTLQATLDAFAREGKRPPEEYVKRYNVKANQKNPKRADYGYAYKTDTYGNPMICFNLNFTLRFK